MTDMHHKTSFCPREAATASSHDNRGCVIAVSNPDFSLPGHSQRSLLSGKSFEIVGFHGIRKLLTVFLAFLFFLTAGSGLLIAESLDLGIHNVGLSIGNSKNWTGLRINRSDREVERINGVNITLLRAQPYQKSQATVTGLSVGLIGPEADVLRGVQIGGITIAKSELSGISLGILGAGGDRVTGITIGGIFGFAEKSGRGIIIGGVGAGGNNITGITLGGFLSGGDNITGIIFGGCFADAGDNMTGITFGGLNAKAKGIRGVVAGGLGAGLGAEAKDVRGVMAGGLLAHGNDVRGVMAGGLAAGGKDVRGAILTPGCAMISEGGSLIGFTMGSFNYIRGSQTGLALGIVNYAYSLNGIQIGLINHVSDNPKYFRTLPFVNAHFK